MKKIKKKVLKSKTKILTIDQSLNGSACYCSDDEFWFCTSKKKNMTDRATFIDVKKLNDISRLSLIKQWFTVILQSVDVNYIALEGYAFSGTGRAFQLGEVGGMIKLVAWEHGIPFIAIPPNSVKLFATGYGNATKTMMVASAITQHQKDFSIYKESGEDICDAFFINQMVQTILKVRKNPKLLKTLPEHQRRALTEKKKKNPSLLEAEFIRG